MDRTPHPMRLLLSLILGLVMSSPAFATLSESHGYAQFGLLKYPANFTHFDWVNPGAPKGGTLRVMAYGTFDTLNPYSFKGSSPSAAKRASAPRSPAASTGFSWRRRISCR